MSPSQPAEWAAAGALASYFMLSVAGHVPGWPARVLKKRDLFEWLPYWTFFAPRPGTNDCHLLYRDQLADGSMTAWREILLTTRRHWWHGIWNPQRRLKKALFDAAMGVHLATRKEKSDIRFSMPYLELLTYVSAIPRFYPAAATQFLVMFSSPADPQRGPQEAIRSDLHRL